MFATLIGNLMGSTYLLDSGMSPTLELVWVIMRNFTNYFILLLVLVLAVMVVTNLGGEESDGIAMLKKNIPKIILAIVAVNFTFFGARAVLTINDILASETQEKTGKTPTPKTAKPNTGKPSKGEILASAKRTIGKNHS